MSEERTYTIGELAAMAGTTARALRHYEDVGLLRPARGANGYRAYGPADARRLARGYLADARFVDYYDGACGKGATEFLADAISANVKDTV